MKRFIQGHFIENSLSGSQTLPAGVEVGGAWIPGTVTTDNSMTKKAKPRTACPLCEELRESRLDFL
jgi:hypothetical protein